MITNANFRIPSNLMSQTFDNLNWVMLGPIVQVLNIKGVRQQVAEIQRLEKRICDHSTTSVLDNLAMDFKLYLTSNYVQPEDLLGFRCPNPKLTQEQALLARVHLRFGDHDRCRFKLWILYLFKSDVQKRGHNSLLQILIFLNPFIIELFGIYLKSDEFSVIYLIFNFGYFFKNGTNFRLFN